MSLATFGAGCAVLGLPQDGATDVGGATPAPSTAGAATSEPPTRDSRATVLELDEALVFDYLLADVAERRGDPGLALEAAVRVAERTKDTGLVLRAFRAAMRSGDADVALAMADLLGESGVDALRVGFARVQAYLVGDRLAEAEAVIGGMLADPPGGDRETVFNNAGEVFAQQSDPGRYVDAMRTLADAYPEDPHGYFAAAYVANRARDFNTLDETISRALELDSDWEQAAVVKFAYLVQTSDHAGAIEFAQTYLEDHPDALDLAHRLARLLAAQGDMEQAHRYFERVLEGQPDNSDILMATALVRMQLEQWSGARRLLERHLALNPESDETRMRLARVATERERFEEAISWYSQITDETFVFEAQLRIADALLDSEGGEAALDHLAGLVPVSRDEEVEQVLVQERVLRDMARLDDAFALLDAAVQDIPGDSDLLYSRGLLAAELGKLEQHEEDIREVIELDPGNAHAYNALGYTLADQTTRYEEALELISRALELAPEDPFILDSMGWVQYRLGKLDVAEQYLRRALAIRDDAEIAAHLGEVLWVRGGKEEAEAMWERALEIDPDNGTLVETLERLKPQ